MVEADSRDTIVVDVAAIGLRNGFKPHLVFDQPVPEVVRDDLRASLQVDAGYPVERI